MSWLINFGESALHLRRLNKYVSIIRGVREKANIKILYFPVSARDKKWKTGSTHGMVKFVH
jgi:hypothetical protein